MAPFAGRLTVRIKARFLLGIGLLLVAGGLLLMGTPPGSSWTVLLPGFIVTGIGIGTVNPVLASAAISVVPPERSGMASGANNTFRQVGIATGIAGLGAVFQSQILTYTDAALAKTTYGSARSCSRAAPSSAAPCRPERSTRWPAHPRRRPRDALLTAYHAGFSTTLNHLMVIGAVVAFVGRRGRDSHWSASGLRGPDGGAHRASGAGRAGRRRRGAADAGVPAGMLEPITLEGTFVRLEPLCEAHIPRWWRRPGRTGSYHGRTRRGPEQMTDYVRDALAKVASGAHVAFATVRGPAGPGRCDLVVGPHASPKSPLAVKPPGATHQRPAYPTSSTSVHLALRYGPAHPRQHRSQAAGHDLRLRGLGRSAGGGCRPTCATSVRPLKRLLAQRRVGSPTPFHDAIVVAPLKQDDIAAL